MATSETAARSGAKCILVVDDDAELRHLLIKAIGDRYAVFEAADGVEAIRQLHRMPSADLIITDVMMPKLDGVQMARWLKSMPTTSKIPIVFLTARDGFADVVGGINAGARQYVTKPFKIADLVERVRRILD